MSEMRRLTDRQHSPDGDSAVRGFEGRDGAGRRFALSVVVKHDYERFLASAIAAPIGQTYPGVEIHRSVAEEARANLVDEGARGAVEHRSIGENSRARAKSARWRLHKAA
jgi:hypothetical protein